MNRKGLAICFYDLVGSTFQQNLDELLAGCLQVHLAKKAKELANQCQGGMFLQSMGDGGMVVFKEDLREGIRFCELIREYFKNEPVFSGIKSEIKISLVYGDPIVFVTLDGKNLYGANISKAARICDIAQSNEVLIDASIYELLNDSEKEKWIDSELETHEKLKGFGQETKCYRLKEGSSENIEDIIDFSKLRNLMNLSHIEINEIIKRDWRFISQKENLKIAEDKQGEFLYKAIWNLAEKQIPEGLLVLADCLHFNGKYSLARKLLVLILNQAKENPNSHAVNLTPLAYHLLGILHLARNNPELAICYYKLALEQLNNIILERTFLQIKKAIIFRDISISLTRLRLFGEAEQKIRESINLLKELLTNDSSFIVEAEIAISFFEYGNFFREQEKYKDASEYYTKALDILDNISYTESYLHRRANILVKYADSEFNLFILSKGKYDLKLFDAYLEKALNVSQDKFSNRLAQINLIKFKKSVLFYKYNNLILNKDAEKYFEKAIENVKAYNELSINLVFYDLLKFYRKLSSNRQKKLLESIVTKTISSCITREGYNWIARELQSFLHEIQSLHN